MYTTNAGPSIRYMFIGCLLSFMAAASPSLAETEWNVGISGGDQGIDGFTFSIGEYYGVPEREVVVIHDRGLCEEELPVVFYIASRAHVSPGAVVDLRLRGMSWMDITFYFGLSPDIYYVPVVVHYYWPQYGHPYGYYHRHPRGGWSRNDLRDRDIVNQVNLRFMSEHYRYAPEKIIKYRSDGRSFRTIERDIRYEQNGKARTQRQNSTYQSEQRLNQNRQNIVRPNQPRPVQKMARPNQPQPVQNMKRPNQLQPAQNMARPNESRQKQDVRKGNNQQRYVQSEKGIGKRWNGN
ncbi:MAG TPA: hypothetical protein PK350_08400 [Deltaproteobacteria bacterium]|nr:hypothetical protein [Deltaproteobacteria bacterium]HPI93139.1 hypothetical protein [Deltaproteobacteria bacterium]HPR56335.1 hypothetical protein [Deltaproteobacteria bacterium]